MNFLCHLCIAPIPCNMYDTVQGSDGVTLYRRERDVWAIPPDQNPARAKRPITIQSR